MKRTVWLKILRILLLAYVGVLLMLMAFERSLVYPVPSPAEGNWNAAEFGAVDVEFASEDGTRLHGWYVEHADPRCQMLFCHGNGEHVGFMGDQLVALSRRLEVSVFAYDYRGYGRSAGKPFEQGVLADSEAAHRWLAERSGVQVDDIVLYGRSIGGGVAVHLAAEMGARALIVERTFHSLVDVAADLYPWLPVRWVMRNRYPSVERIARYDGPLLQLHGEADRIVPIESGRKLFAASPSLNKAFVQQPGMTHNSLTPKKFYQQVDDLLDAL